MISIARGNGFRGKQARHVGPALPAYGEVGLFRAARRALDRRGCDGVRRRGDFLLAGLHAGLVQRLEIALEIGAVEPAFHDRLAPGQQIERALVRHVHQSCEHRRDLFARVSVKSVSGQYQVEGPSHEPILPEERLSFLSFTLPLPSIRRSADRILS
jgi:hypothetical protein